MRQRFRSASRTAKTAIILFFTMVAAASAYYVYVSTTGGEGTGSNKLGTVEPGENQVNEHLPITVAFGPGLKPGGREPLALEWKNTTSTPHQVYRWTTTFIVSEPQEKEGCSPAFFKVEGGEHEWAALVEEGHITHKELIIPPNGTLKSEGLELVFLDNGQNQNACSGAEITLHIVSEP
jgi:hypothetical protein